jgi:predicted kinase
MFQRIENYIKQNFYKKSMTQKIILTIGLPASGKSTWAKQHIKDHPEFKIVCRDDIRAMLDNGEWSTQNEETVLRIRDKVIYTLLDSGHSVIVADTNLSEKVRKRIKDIAKYVENTLNRPIVIEEKSFLDVPVEECIRRDLVRPNSVGSRVINDMAKRNGLLGHVAQENTSNKDGIPCYISDIDGTVALMNGRSPYDYNKVGSDIPRFHVLRTLQSLNTTGTDIIFVSGRPESCRKETENWLNLNYGNDYVLYMRATGDNRSDEIIKKELYDKHIKDTYFVVGVFDDRPRVIRNTWKAEGIPVFDVAQSEEF